MSRHRQVRIPLTAAMVAESERAFSACRSRDDLFRLHLAGLLYMPEEVELGVEVDAGIADAIQAC